MTEPSIKDFEAAVAELESIVKKLEDGSSPSNSRSAVRARRPVVALRHARLEESRAADRDPQRARRAQASAGVPLEPGFRTRLSVAPADSFAAFLERTRLLLDEALRRWLPAPPACPPILSEAMRYSVFAGGKRLRPTLTLAAADAVEKARGHSGIGEADVAQIFGRAVDLALPAACAVEMIHTYSLIHDDLPSMDNDTLRRGRPTLHVVYGDGMAVLAGDGLQAEAFALLGREPRHDGQDSTDVAEAADLLARKLRTLSVIAQAAGAVGMVGGQAIDLQAAGQTPGGAVTLDAEGLKAMHARKTGAMIRASAAAGAIMAGGDDTTIAAVTSYAAEVGLAFQIVDDILDVEGSAQQLGKTAGKDAAGAKPTYVALYGLDRSRVLADECLARARSALERAGLTNGHLGAIGDWAVRRKT